MRGKLTILVGLVAIAVTAGLAPARSEACEFFRRIFCCRQRSETVPPPAISPGVPVYPEESAYYRYAPASGTTVYYGTPVVTYYRAPSTTVYYSGPSCASSAKPTPALVPEPQTEPEGGAPTYAPEEAPQAFDQQELRNSRRPRSSPVRARTHPRKRKTSTLPNPRPCPKSRRTPAPRIRLVRPVVTNGWHRDSASPPCPPRQERLIRVMQKVQ